MSNEVTQFLQRIVPDYGLLCIAHVRDIPAAGRKRKKWTQDFFTPKQVSNGVLVKHIDELNEHRDTNVYFSVATFNERDRHRQHVKGLKAFVIDVDLHTSGKTPVPVFAGRTEAVAGLLKLWKEVRCLPKPTIVDSGRGLHAYFAFDEPVSAEEWGPVSKVFRRVVKDVDARLMADPKPTIDAARVMRVPNTWHAKQKRREFCRVLQGGEPGPFEKMREGLNQEAHKRRVWDDLDQGTGTLLDGAAPDHASGESSAASSLSGGLATSGRTRFEELSVKDIATGCKQMSRMLELKGDVSEPEWLLMLRVLSVCKNADDLAQVFSSGHPNYTRTETARKLRHVRNNFGSACASCEEFQLLDPDPCKRCRFRKKVWTPAQISERMAREQQRKEDLRQAHEKVERGEKSTGGYLPLPPYYHQGVVNETKEKITNIPVDLGKDAGSIDKGVIRAWIHVVGSSRVVTRDAAHNESSRDLRIHFDVEMWREKHRVTVSAAKLSDNLPRATEVFRDIGVVFRAGKPNERAALMEFFQTVVQLAAKAPLPWFEMKGWDPRQPVGRKSLTLGAKRFLPNGSVVKGYTQGEHTQNTTSFVEDLCDGRPRGGLGKWKRAMGVYDGDYPHAHMVLLSGVGNLLFPLLGMDGGILLSLSGESGVGKTTLVRFMNSFLGDPSRGIIPGSATTNALGEMLKQAGCFMLTVDDTMNLDAEAQSLLLATVTSGKTKVRLQQDDHGEFRPSELSELNASLILTSNYSSTEAFMQRGTSRNRLQLEAAQTRMLEIPAENVRVPGVEMKRWHWADNTIRENNGHAVTAFAQYVVSNQEAVQLQLKKLENRLQKNLNRRIQRKIPGQVRFWCKYLAAVGVAGGILKVLGLISWSIPNILEVGQDLALDTESGTREIQGNDMTVLWDILTDDLQGKRRINYTEWKVENESQWPDWKDRFADRQRAQLKEWVSGGAAKSLFSNVSQKVVNSPEWRLHTTEVWENGSVKRVERGVFLKITTLRDIVFENRSFASMNWEELYYALRNSGCQVVGVRDDKPGFLAAKRKNVFLSASEDTLGLPCSGIEIKFPPLVY